jgi:hypothetical protein
MKDGGHLAVIRLCRLFPRMQGAVIEPLSLSVLALGLSGRCQRMERGSNQGVIDTEQTLAKRKRVLKEGFSLGMVYSR